jgi:hypothetical protein
MSPTTRHFVRHYIEMVIVMFLGMAILWLPTDAALLAAGTSSGDVSASAPALMLAWMAVTMTAPMVGWMRYRGHRWRPCLEMAASMIIPTLGTIALLATGVITDVGTLTAIEHPVMLLGMLVAMLARRDEYSCGAHRHAVAREAAR